MACATMLQHPLRVIHNPMLSANADSRILVVHLARPLDLEISAAEAVAWLAMRPPNRFLKSALTIAVKRCTVLGGSSIAVHTRISIFAPASSCFVITPASSFIVVAPASSRVVAYRYYSASHVSVTRYISYTCLFLTKHIYTTTSSASNLQSINRPPGQADHSFELPCTFRAPLNPEADNSHLRRPCKERPLQNCLSTRRTRLPRTMRLG